MFKLLRRMFAFLLLSSLLVACSSTTLSSSWKSPDFRGQVRKIYLVCVAKDELNRRVFEDEFGQQFHAMGTATVSSYKDLASPGDADQKAVAERISANNADSVLIGRVVSSRVEEVTFNSGRIENSWGSYYDRRYVAIYDAPTTAQFEIVTIEANLYDAKSGKLIWAAQLETVIDPNFQKMVADFVKTVTEDLQKKGLI